MKRGWMRSLAGVSGLLAAGFWANAPTAQPQMFAAPAGRANELMLAGLRPGKDTRATAISRYKKASQSDAASAEYSWNDECRHEVLHIVLGPSGTLEEVRVAEGTEESKIECAKPIRSPWRTGKNLAIGDAATRVIALYGEPDSRSPSSKDGQTLELLYYAFDWAGPDVPQVLVVLCTVEKAGKPGRVVEITLDASSL